MIGRRKRYYDKPQSYQAVIQRQRKASVIIDNKTRKQNKIILKHAKQ